MAAGNGAASANGHEGLAKPPARRMAAGLRRWLLGAITVALLFLALWARVLPQEADLVVGKPAPRTILAPRSAFYTDTTRTDELRDAARRSVPDQYNANPSATDMALGVVQDVFGIVRQSLKATSATSAADKVEWVRRRLDVTLPDEVLMGLIQAQPGVLTRLQASCQRLVRDLMSEQIRDNTQDLEHARQQAMDQAQELPISADFRQAVGDIVAAALQPNLFYDREGTNRAREAAADAVKPARGYIRAGEVVVYAGNTVSERQFDMAQGLGLTQPRVDYTQAGGLLVLLALLVAGFAIFLFEFAPEYYEQEKYLFVSAALAVTAALLFRTAQGMAWFEAAALGTATAGVVAECILTTPLVAVAFGGFLSVLVGLMAAGSDARLVIATLLATVCTAGAMGRGFQRSTVIARTALIAGLANAVFLLLGDLVWGLLISWQLIGQTAGAGFAGAVAGVGLVLVLQRPLKVTTDMWLLELGNPNEPVLRRLLTEAPGTYQASLMVATLAEAAAEAIGANALLTRVAATYHDIGKLKRPGFFIENQFRGENPHEKLAPQVSAMILAAHVREGVEMARQLRLPLEVIAAIEQHQGTSIMAYFYDKARSAAKPGEEVPESLYRYPGPKPQSKEAALVMLADSVEATARTLESYSPETIGKMVDRIVQGKIDDGQLDDAPLTFAELTRVKGHLTSTLVSAFHRRIPYPEQIERELAHRAQQRREPLEHPAAAAAGGGKASGHDSGGR